MGPRGSHGNEPEEHRWGSTWLWRWSGQKGLKSHLERKSTGLGDFMEVGMRERRSLRWTSWALDPLHWAFVSSVSSTGLCKLVTNLAMLVHTNGPSLPEKPHQAEQPSKPCSLDCHLSCAILLAGPGNET